MLLMATETQPSTGPLARVTLVEGPHLRILCVIDDFIQECLVTTVDTLLSGECSPLPVSLRQLEQVFYRHAQTLCQAQRQYRGWYEDSVLDRVYGFPANPDQRRQFRLCQLGLQAMLLQADFELGSHARSRNVAIAIQIEGAQISRTPSENSAASRLISKYCVKKKSIQNASTAHQYPN